MTSSPRPWAVVPVKPFELAKRRLAPLLTGQERAHLARLMLEDVLSCLAGCAGLAGTIVVGPIGAVRDIAHAHRALVLADRTENLNGAVGAASAYLRRANPAGMVVVAGDIPLLPARVIEDLIAHLDREPAVGLVPATRDGGTNLLACRPVNMIAPRFGADSFRVHARSARAAGLEPLIITSAEAGLDIDRPEDLAALLARKATTRSAEFLMSLRLERRPDGMPGQATGLATRADEVVR